MGKKCVRPAVLSALIALIGIIATAVPALAQSSDPSTLPLLTAEGLRYVGGFRVPAESVNGDSFSIGGRPIAFNPAGNSLFIGSRAGRVAEVSIPIAINSANVNDLPWASFLQPFNDPTEGHLAQVSSEGVAIDGLLVRGNRLYGTASIYYDANNTQRVSHYSRGLRLTPGSFSGWSQVWESGKAGFVAGVMADVPSEWQSRLGGTAVTGQCCIPIVSRTSWGPAAFAFNPDDIGQARVAASPLLYYTGEHPTLGLWDASNPTYGATIQITGMAIIAGTRTAIYVGRNGLGPNCYGNGTSNASLNGTYGPDGAMWCYDPTTSDKGSHAYPYRYQVWAYDLNDFVAVKEGRKQPWDVLPYGVWPFNLLTPESSVKLGGVGYDATHQMLYISQLGADQDGYSYRPIIHAVHVEVPTTASPAPAPAPTPAPAPAPKPAPPAPTPASSWISNVTISANRVAPQPVGTPVTFTATVYGGLAPFQYKWWTYNGDNWVPATAWVTSNTFAWTSPIVIPGGRVTVWVRNAGSTADEAEGRAAMDFEITPQPGTTPIAILSSVTIAANLVAPQRPGTTVTFTATTNGGASAQYKWWVYNGDAWVAVTGWIASNTFAWTPAATNLGGRITVWVRSPSSTADVATATAAMDFVIKDR